MRGALLLLVVAGAFACDLRCQWTNWKAEYGKSYTASEEERRFEVFKMKLEEIKRLNAENPDAIYAPNQFTDLTTEEFLGTYARLDNSMKRMEPADNVLPEKTARQLPTEWISPDVTPVRNQASCGSCWAFATMAVVEGAYHKATGKTVQLSTQQLVDCVTASSGCNGGNYDSALAYLKKVSTSATVGGAVLEASYPYTSASGTSTGSCKALTGTITVKAYGSVKMNEAVGSGVDVSLQSYGPMGIAVDATTLQSYSGGIAAESTKGVNHAVTLVGWGTSGGQNVWIVKNSWGTSWGIAPPQNTALGKGFFMMRRGSNSLLVTSWGAYWAQVYATGDGTPTCTPKTAAQVCGTAKCGTVSDGCSGTVSCGTCTTGQTCSAGVCQSNACTPKTTAVACGTAVCGSASDGCGNYISCGSCASNQQCSSGQCSCKPLTVSSCGSATCGQIEDGCGGFVTCGTCGTGQTCVAGQCQGTCVPVDSSACGSAVCGTVSNGCGGSVSCGTCLTGQTCTAGQCVTPPPATSDWTQITGAAGDFSIATNPTVISTATTTTTEKIAKWTSSKDIMSAEWSSFSALVQATGTGTIGLGMRLGQSGNDLARLSFKIVITSSLGTASFKYCYQEPKSASELCGTLVKSFTMTMNAKVNFTVVVTNVATGVGFMPMLGGKGLYKNPTTAAIGWSTQYLTTYTLPLLTFPLPGSAFVVASGAGKSFTSPTLVTRSAVKLAMSECFSQEQIAAYIAMLLQVDPAAIVSIDNLNPCPAKRQDLPTFKGFVITLQDSDQTKMLGQTAPFHSVATGTRCSADLARSLTQMLSQGGASNLGYDVASASVVAPAAAAEAAVETLAVAGASAAALSTGAIIGIVVGGAAGLALLATLGGLVAYAATRPEPSTPIPDDFQPRNPMRKTFYKIKAAKGGVDVMNAGANHSSITGRAPPIA